MAKSIRVQKGQCISSIAYDNGFFRDTLWAWPENSNLHQLRKNMFVLEEGDEVFIPDLRQRQVPAPTDRRHDFRRKGVPEWLRVRLVNADDTPRAALSYTLKIKPGILRSGVTDAAGWIIQPIPPNATSGLLQLPEGETYELSLGFLSPADSIRGMQQRLHNLSYDCGDDPPGEIGPGTTKAIQLFMLDETRKEFEVTPEALPDVQTRLQSRHGS